MPDPAVPLVPVPVWPEPLLRLDPVPEDVVEPVPGEVAEPIVVPVPVPEPVLGAVELVPALVPGADDVPVPDPLVVPELLVSLPTVEPVLAVEFPVVEPVPAADPGGQFPFDASVPVDDDAPDVPVPELPELDPLVCAAAQKDMVAVRPTASANATAFCIRPPLIAPPRPTARRAGLFRRVRPCKRCTPSASRPRCRADPRGRHCVAGRSRAPRAFAARDCVDRRDRDHPEPHRALPLREGPEPRCRGDDTLAPIAAAGPSHDREISTLHDPDRAGRAISTLNDPDRDGL